MGIGVDQVACLPSSLAVAQLNSSTQTFFVFHDIKGEFVPLRIEGTFHHPKQTKNCCIGQRVLTALLGREHYVW